MNVLSTDTMLVLGFAGMSSLWLAASLYVIASRLAHERRTHAIHSLSDALARTDAAGRRGVLFALQRIVARRSRRAVYRLVANTSLPARVTDRLAAYSIERWGIARIMRDASPDAGPTWRRISALIALAHLRAPGVHALLERAIVDDDQDVAAAALVGLHRLGDRQSAAVLILALVRGSYARSRIATQLDGFDTPIDDMLRPLLTNPRADARYWAASLLRRYPNAPGLGAAVAALAHDPDAPVRRAVLGTLGAIRATESTRVAEKLLGDPVAYVRAHAARLLASTALGAATVAERRRVAQRLVHLLGDTEWDVRLAVKESLVLLGEDVWRDVAATLDSPDRFARNSAAEVLQNLGLVDVLVRELGDGAHADSELLGVLERAFRAGGAGMVDAAAARSASSALASPAALLARLGLVSPGLAQ